MKRQYQRKDKSITIEGDDATVARLVKHLALIPDDLSFESFVKKARALATLSANETNARAPRDHAHVNVFAN